MRSNDSDAFIALPNKQHLFNSIKLSLIFLFIFYTLFGATDLIAQQHNYRIHAYFDWELNIPRLISLSIIYLSLTPMLLLAPFIIRNGREFKIFFKLMVFETIVASLFFLAMPMEDAYAYQPPSGFFATFFNIADFINLTYNEFPSLHVAFAFTAALTYSRYAKSKYKIIMFIWASLIAISTVLTHQHHLIGVISGALLAWLAFKLIKVSE